MSCSMLRHWRVFDRRRAGALVATDQPRRTKIIQAQSLLDRAERIKTWNRDNKKLFGALLNEDAARQDARPQRTIRQYYNAEELNHSSFEKRTKFIRSDSISKATVNQKEIVPRFKYAVIKNDKYGGNLKSNLSSDKIAKTTEKMPPNSGLFNKANFGVPSIIIRNLKVFPMMSVQKVNVADGKPMEPLDGKPITVSSDDNLEYSKFPSVTKILDQTMSEQARAALEKWKQEKIAELGLEGFERFNRAQLDRGKMFHELLRQYMLNNQSASIDQTLEGVWSSVTPILKNIINPKAVESYVSHPVLKYRGIIDCVAMYQDKPTLIEWKKSDKPKPALSATFDNPVQLAAYFGAISHDPNYKNMNVRDALLVIAYTDGSPADAFHLGTDQMRQYWATWLTRLEKFYTINETKNETENKETTQKP